MYQGALNGATLATKAMYVFVAIGFFPDVDRARAFLWKRKSCLQNSDRIRMDCIETLRLLEG